MTHISTEQLANEPILICTYADHMSPEDVFASFHVIREIALTFRKPFGILIIDTSLAEGTFQEMITLLKINDDPAADADMQFDMRLIMVGTSAMVKFYVNAAKQQQFGAQTIPLFAHLEDAIDAARTMVRTHEQGDMQPTGAE